MSKPQQTPYRAEQLPLEDEWTIYDSNNKYVGTAQTKKDKDFIIAACNSRNALVEALRAMLSDMKGVEDSWDNPVTLKHIIQAKQALKQAGDS